MIANDHQLQVTLERIAHFQRINALLGLFTPALVTLLGLSA